jgi:thymidylate kinase
MVFIVLEGFSGTGKTSIALALEKRGWIRLPESAHSVPKAVPVADRADTSSDYALFGATMIHCSAIARQREKRRIVSEGYLLSDLAYAKIRYDLGKSKAYPSMLTACREIIRQGLGPDLYVQLEVAKETIEARQRLKEQRERNQTWFFRTRYYSALREIHTELGEQNFVIMRSDSAVDSSTKRVLEILRERELLPS